MSDSSQNQNTTTEDVHVRDFATHEVKHISKTPEYIRQKNKEYYYRRLAEKEICPCCGKLISTRIMNKHLRKKSIVPEFEILI